MVKPEDIPEKVPEMDVVKPEQEQVITDLLESVKGTNGGEYPFLFAREEDELARRDLAYKFLKARRWKLKDAMAMVTNTVQFRKDHGLDTWRLFPCAFPLLGFDEKDIVKTVGCVPGATVPLDGRTTPTEWDMCYRALQSSYVNVYHYWDKEGHPVLYDCCGKANVSGIMSRLHRVTPVGKGLKDVIVPYHTYMNEVQYYLIRYANAKAREHTSAGLSSETASPLACADRTLPPSRASSAIAPPEKKIMGITVVLDAEGMHLGMLQRRFISVVRAIFNVDQSYYPEVLHRLFVINCPALIQTAYSVVKSALDENTRAKVVFCSKSDSLPVLRRVIDEDKIPQELGGGCRCTGGCLPCYKDPENGEDGESGNDPPYASAVEAPTEHLTIKAGKKLTRDIVLHAGEALSWQFALEHSDVLFSASFEILPPRASQQASPASAGPDTDVESTVTSSPRSKQFYTPVSAASPKCAVSPFGAAASLSVRPLGSPEESSSPSAAASARVCHVENSSVKHDEQQHAPADSVDASHSARDNARDSCTSTSKNVDAEMKSKSKKGGQQKHKDPNSSNATGCEVVNIKQEKLSADVDCYRATEDGVLHLRWDNSRSWVSSKKVQLRVFNGRIE